MWNNQEKSSIKLSEIPTKRYLKTIMSPPKNSKNNNNILKALGWNARSIRERTRKEFMWHTISRYKPDVAIIVETWLNENVKILNTEHQVAQTKKQEFQGVLILKKDMDIKIEWEDQQTGWFLVCINKKENKIWAYLIGFYRKVEWKEETTQEINKIIKRIRRKHPRISIIIFGDMNTKGKDSINKLEKK